MKVRYIIYGLIDPRNGQLRYVGKSCSGLERPKSHARKAKVGRTHKDAWLRQLLAAGLKPEVEVLEVCDSAEALVEAEVFHIAYWRMVGADLTNLTAGGEGLVGFRHSTATRNKISTSKTGGAVWAL